MELQWSCNGVAMESQWLEWGYCVWSKPMFAKFVNNAIKQRVVIKSANLDAGWLSIFVL